MSGEPSNRSTISSLKASAYFLLLSLLRLYGIKILQRELKHEVYTKPCHMILQIARMELLYGT